MVCVDKPLPRLFGFLSLLFVSVSCYSVEIRSIVSVSRPNIYMRDLLQQQGELTDAVYNMRVKRAPRADTSIKLSRQWVQNLIHQYLPLTEVQGPEYVTVKARFQQSAVEKYHQLSEKALLEKIYLAKEIRSLVNAEVFVEPAQEVRPLSLPVGEYSFVVDKIMPRSVKPRMVVSGSLFVDGEHYQSLQYAFIVKVFADAWKISDSAEQDDRVNGRVVKSRFDVASFISNLYAGDELDSLRFSKKVRKGQVLKNSYVEKVPLVEKNKEVMVSSYAGNVVINSKAVSTQDGFLGDEVALYRDNQAILFNARVIAENKVAIYVQ